ncbi:MULTISPECIES: DUF4232 domain-containing protein [unclassified Streptomyces]|uniref:DUF4232 domain-containing protein n=1 Tax=unclassified Streptomyces TaxID=2593676 RepID=UPI000381DBF2|nr:MULTISPECIES: DUF4232 domain-containing protein [unclassified Streptomyces]MYX35172.1 DUF4232 domain-containing protein [Streptomyces sp. SID8377]
MERRNTRRAAIAAALTATAAVLLTGCQGDVGAAGSGAGDGAGGGSSAPTAPPTAAPSRTAGDTVPASSTSPAPGGSAEPAGRCDAEDLEATAAHQAAVRPQGTGTGAAVVGFTNTSGAPCVVEGFPTVAGAANGSPEMNVPLTVRHTGTAAPVALAPGGRAWVKLTFHQVQGEGDGSCASGEAPVQYPTMVLGLPGGAGRHQVALDDGVFAECDGVAAVTALSAAEPS